MKEILCFGDSNTWGYSPAGTGRFPRDIRWTGVLQTALGSGFFVIEEGLNGRTTVWEDPIEGDKVGKRHLLPCLLSHAPLDLVVLLLGTNDLKKRYSAATTDIAQGVEVLLDIVAASKAGPEEKAPQVLLVAPPPLAKLSAFAQMFEGGTEKSKSFSALFAQVAAAHGCPFLDAGSVVRSSDLDGIHLDAPEHRKLGEAIAREVRKILG
ncbi:MAG TPA: SGNH/GDSL hydrolase family protein [Spirochaetia bacterium]